jgi:hypothetical protein
LNKLLFIGCNHDQLPYLLELKKYQFDIIGTDINPNAPGKNLCNKFYHVAYDDLDGLIEVGVNENFTCDDKVFTVSAQFAHKGAAHFSNKFDIKYPKESNIDLCLDKTLFYKRFQKLNIPIPETSFISDKDELINAVSNSNKNTNYYLKSDFSKNPNYVYRFNINNLKIDEMFWGRDRYLQNHYILQKEFFGESIRINIYGDRFNVFQFDPMKKMTNKKDKIIKLGVIESLASFIKDQHLEKWLIKFDIIIDKENYVVLDVGLDPPFRMVNESKLQNINFAKHYVKHYLQQQVEYPESLD